MTEEGVMMLKAFLTHEYERSTIEYGIIIAQILVGVICLIYIFN